MSSGTGMDVGMDGATITIETICKERTQLADRNSRQQTRDLGDGVAGRNMMKTNIEWQTKEGASGDRRPRAQ